MAELVARHVGAEERPHITDRQARRPSWHAVGTGTPIMINVVQRDTERTRAVCRERSHVAVALTLMTVAVLAPGAARVIARSDHGAAARAGGRYGVSPPALSISCEARALGPRDWIRWEASRPR
jgi:hypothetical protein